MRNLPSLFKNTQSNDLTVWQFALLKSIQLRPSHWIDGHRDVEALPRRTLGHHSRRTVKSIGLSVSRGRS
jgi:hypothetical protein